MHHILHCSDLAAYILKAGGAGHPKIARIVIIVETVKKCQKNWLIKDSRIVKNVNIIEILQKCQNCRKLSK